MSDQSSTQNPMLTDFYRAAELGLLDHSLDQIREVVSARKAIIALQAGQLMTAGTRVRFAEVPDNKDGWVGITGVVKKKARGGKAVTIKLDDDTPRIIIGRRRDPIFPGQEWTVPCEWLEVV